MAFWGDVCVEKIDFLGSCCRENGLFGEVFVEKMDCAGDKMKTIAVLIHVVPSPFVRCSVLTLSQPCEYHT